MMAKRRAAQKAKAALAVVSEDAGSDRELKREDADASESSFEGSSSASEEESEVESKRLRKAGISEKKYEFSRSSSSDSSSAEEKASAMTQRKKRSRLVRPTKESSDSSSSDELSAFGGDVKESVQRKKPNTLKTRQKTKVSNVQELSSSSSDDESGMDEERRPRTTPVRIKRDMKRVSDSNRIKIEGSSGSSSEEDSVSEVKGPLKKLAPRSDNKQVNSSNTKGSSSSSSSGDDSELEQNPLQMKNLVPVKNIITTTELRKSSKFELLSSSSSSDSELEKQEPQQITSPLKSSPNARSANDFSDFKELSSSSSAEDNDKKQNMNDPLNIEPKTYDIEPESDSSGGGSASETDSDVAWPPQETKKDDNSGEDDIVEESNKGSALESEEDEWQDEGKFAEDEVENDGNLSDGEVRQAKYVMRNITSFVPLIEETAIRRGVKPTGPPIEFATTHLDEYARKFRWPQHVRNLRNADFSQDPSEILEDYEVLPEAKQRGTEDQDDHDALKECAFAQVPRPIVALAAEALHRSSRKRKRAAGSENREETSEQTPSASALLNIARIGGRFGDKFVESLLSANGKALQGIDNGCDYDKRCWSSLPTKKKPIANWRFVLEHVRRTMCRPDDPDAAIYPPMKQETLERITKRLKNLYGHTTKHEEYDIFKVTSANSNNRTTEGDN